MPRETLSVRDGRPEDEPAVWALLQRTFGPRSVEMFEWRYHHAPFPTLMLVLCDENGTIMGCGGMVFLPGWIDGRPVEFGRGGDLAVAHPGRGDGKLLLTALMESGAGRVRYAFPAEHASKLVATVARHPRLGRLPQWVRWATPGALAESRGRGLPSPVSGLVGLVLSAVRTVAGWPRSLTIKPLSEPGPEIDVLAREAASFAPCIMKRDAAFFRWRWLAQPGRQWHLSAAHDGSGRLRGVVVYGVQADRLHGGRPVGRVVDLLAHDATAARVLVDHAARWLESAGCVMTLCDLSDPRHWSGRALIRAGFLPRGEGAAFHATGGPGYESVNLRSNWYLTMGDTDLV
jgi:hypothetical protein